MQSQHFDCSFLEATLVLLELQAASPFWPPEKWYLWTNLLHGDFETSPFSYPAQYSKYWYCTGSNFINLESWMGCKKYTQTVQFSWFLSWLCSLIIQENLHTTNRMYKFICTLVCTERTRTTTYPSTVYGKSLLTTTIQRICLLPTVPEKGFWFVVVSPFTFDPAIFAKLLHEKIILSAVKYAKKRYRQNMRHTVGQQHKRIL